MCGVQPAVIRIFLIALLASIFLGLLEPCRALASPLNTSAQGLRSIFLLGSTLPIPLGFPWWGVLLGLFCFATLLGVVGALAGIGGGVLFVPIVSGFFPFFHLDYVRGAGLVVALSGALAGGPQILGQHLVHFRMALPCALLASLGAIAGALVGLSLSPEYVLRYLGLLIVGAALVMLIMRPKVVAVNTNTSLLARWLRLSQWHFLAEEKTHFLYTPQRVALGLGVFLGIGFMAGMFGIGAGWANTPALNLLLQMPLRMAVATSYFILAVVNSAAALIYLGRGVISPWLVLPAATGMMLGARIGVCLLAKAPLSTIRLVTVGVLLMAGLRALSNGFGW